METRKLETSSTTNKEYLKNEQYAGMNNYQHRKDIYQHGNNIPLTEWLSTQYAGSYNLSGFDQILEVGCGNGTFWQHTTGVFQSSVVITDLSEKMLEECKRNLSTVNIKANYQVVDIDVLPYGKGTFNAVLAHNVIYHAVNPENSIAGMQEVLKPNGIFGMSVLNQGANQSIWKIANSIDSRVPAQSFTSRFTNIEADKILPTVFKQVEKKEYFNTLRFKTSEPVVNMVKSSPAVQPLKLSDSFFTLFKEKVEAQISDKGYFESELNASLYLCRK
jgi:2-polyprenyl-3-methyl-5-hydroxy-6-metoxy-1,4-benzoquinol methylase